jgi:hypothetical protein
MLLLFESIFPCMLLVAAMQVGTRTFSPLMTKLEFVNQFAFNVCEKVTSLIY